MKRLFVVMCMISITLFMLNGCAENTKVSFNEFYSEIIGFSDTDEYSKPVPKDAILMVNNEEFETFKDEYFTSRDIKIESPDQDKAVLYLQIASPKDAVNRYIVKSILVKDDTLIVKVAPTSVSLVDSADVFDGTWKWVMFVEVDKKDLKDHMKISVKR